MSELPSGSESPAGESPPSLIEALAAHTAVLRAYLEETRTTNKLLAALVAQNSEFLELLTVEQEGDGSQPVDLSGNPIRSS